MTQTIFTFLNLPGGVSCDRIAPVTLSIDLSTKVVANSQARQVQIEAELSIATLPIISPSAG